MPASPGLDTLFIRLYLDRHIMTRLAVDLRAHGYDVVTTEEAGNDTASDQEQLFFATTEGRAILTFNIRDFAPLHEQHLAAGQSHGGIIVSQQLGSRQYGILLQRMLRLLNQLTAEEMLATPRHPDPLKEPLHALSAPV